MKNEADVHILKFLIELRKRLVNSILVLVGIFISSLYFSNDLYTGLALPLLKNLPHGQGLIATNIVAPFFTPMELTFFFAAFLGMPFFLYQLWGFIAPALYSHEKRMIWPLLCISTSLFYCGVAFAYFIVLPILFSFITHSAPKGVLVSPDITQYLDFTLKIFFVFGIIFEIPIITILLIWTGITSREQLIKMRPYVIVGAFILGMLLGPPDVLSQTMLAVPMWLLFETGIFLAKSFFIRK